MNKFLKDLEKELKKLRINTKEIEEIIEDHKEMIESAQKEGLDDKKIEEKFGSPIKVANDIFEDSVNPAEQEEYNFENVESCVEKNTEDYSLVKTFPVISESIAIEIRIVSDDLSITSYEGESIQVYEDGIKNINGYTIEFNNNTLTIIKNKNKLSIVSFSRKSGSFLVLVPNNIEISNFDAKVVSGDIEMNLFKINEFKVKSTSGDVEMTNIDVTSFKASTVSGDIKMSQIKAKTFEVSVVSGDVKVDKTVIQEEVYLHSVSGDFELFEVECNGVFLKTVSGDLDGKEFYPQKLSLKSVSGDVNITNRNVLKEINVISKKTVSGDINIK